MASKPTALAASFHVMCACVRLLDKYRGNNRTQAFVDAKAGFQLYIVLIINKGGIFHWKFGGKLIISSIQRIRRKTKSIFYPANSVEN